jgi:hypothetical protein
MPDETNTETQSPQVMPGAALPEAATPEGAGAGVGQSVVEGAMIGVRVQHDEQMLAQQEEDHRNQVMALAGATDLESYDINGLHGKDGLFTKDPGSNAQQMGDDYLSKRAQYAAKVRQGLSPGAQELFDRHERERSLQTQQQVYEWQDRSDKVFDQKVVQANLQNTVNRALLQVNEPDPTKRSYAVNQSLAEGSMAIIDQAKRQGLDFSKKDDAQVIQQRLDTFTSSVVGEVTKGLADKGDMAGARAFYDEHKDDLTAKDRLSVENVLKAGTERDQARQMSDSILRDQQTEAKGDPLKVSLEDALNRLEAKNITDTQLHDAVRDRIVGDFRRTQEAHNEQQRSLMNAAGQELEDESNTEHGVSLSVMEQLDPKNREAITKWQRHLIAGEKIKQSDDDTRLSLREMAANPEAWDAFLGTPPETYRAKLNDADYKWLQNTYAEVAAKAQKRDQTLSQGMWADKVGIDVLKENGLWTDGIDPRKDKAGYDAARKRASVFLDQLHRSVGAKAMDQKQQLDEQGIREAANDLLTTQTWQRPAQGFWENLTHDSGGNDLRGRPIQRQLVTASGYAFEGPTAAKFAYSTRDLKPADLAKVIQEAEKRGEKIMDEKKRITPEGERILVDAYNAKLATTYAKSVSP